MSVLPMCLSWVVVPLTNWWCVEFLLHCLAVCGLINSIDSLFYKIRGTRRPVFFGIWKFFLSLTSRFLHLDSLLYPWKRRQEITTGYKWHSGNLSGNVGDAGDGFSPWVGKGPLEKEMATHSRILAWKIPWAEEPGGLQFMGLQESDMTGHKHTHIIYLEFKRKE